MTIFHGRVLQVQGQRVSDKSEIRRVDFLNFTYHPSLCAREYGSYGIGKTVRVRDGEYKHGREWDEVYFGVVNNRIIYGDLTGDGHDEAIVHAACGLMGANYGLSEIFIYTMRNGNAVLLTSISDEDTDRDYHRYYRENPNTLAGSLWRIIDDGVKIQGGLLTVERFVDGAHCCPKNIATMNYRWNGDRLLLVGKPLKRRFVQK